MGVAHSDDLETRHAAAAAELEREYGAIVSKAAILGFLQSGGEERVKQHKEERDPQCDVCGFDRECGNGGRALREVSSWSLVCESCWTEFTNVDESKGQTRRIADKVGRCIALRLRVGLEPKTLTHTFNPECSFVVNAFRFQQKHSSDMYMTQTTVALSSRAVDAHAQALTLTRDFSSRRAARRSDALIICPSCTTPIAAAKLRKCSFCALVHYCSRDCQRADRLRHRPFCRAHPAKLPVPAPATTGVVCLPKTVDVALDANDGANRVPHPGAVYGAAAAPASGAAAAGCIS